MSDQMTSERLEAFRAEVADVKVGGKNPAKTEQVVAVVGIVAMLAGIAVAFLAYSTAQNAGDLATVQRQQVLAIAAAALAIAGAICWLRVSITRHMRWWMIRNIYEQREQTDRLLDAARDPR